MTERLTTVWIKDTTVVPSLISFLCTVSSKRRRTTVSTRTGILAICSRTVSYSKTVERDWVSWFLKERHFYGTDILVRPSNGSLPFDLWMEAAFLIPPKFTEAKLAYFRRELSTPRAAIRRLSRSKHSSLMTTVASSSHLSPLDSILQKRWQSKNLITIKKKARHGMKWDLAQRCGLPGKTVSQQTSFVWQCAGWRRGSRK